jgi:AGCS family alanine or glycine:cation symporter
MDAFLNAFGTCLKEADAFLWGPPLLILLLGTHLFYTIRLHFIQKHLWTALKVLSQRDGKLNGTVGPFAALAVALASTIGTGNVVGVATAVALGGPGAVFWCMMTGIFGMATKYAESLLAVKYRIQDETGAVHGGPMYTILNGLKCRWLAVAFAVFASVAVLGTGNLVQSNAIADSLLKTFSLPTWITGAGTALLVGLVLIGGLKSIAKVCTYFVPFLAFVYLTGCGILLWMNCTMLDDAVLLIVKSAFTPKAAAGGVFGYGAMLAIRYGVARGLFSNEAGMGSEPIVAATAQTRNAVRQGLVSYSGTFCSIIICALTGVVIVSSALAHPETVDLRNNGILTQSCFELLPGLGRYILSFVIFTFASTTTLGWFYYGEECLRFLCKNRKVLFGYKIFYVFLIFLGAVSSLEVVWDFANFFNGLMIIPNIASLLLLQKVVVSETRKYLWNKENFDTIDPECVMENKQ